MLSFFNDAYRIKLNALRGIVSLPARLLFISLPLTFLLGTLLAGRLLKVYWVEIAGFENHFRPERELFH